MRVVGENTAKLAGGSYIKARYADLIEPRPAKKELTAEEIAAQVIASAGLEVKNKDESI